MSGWVIFLALLALVPAARAAEPPLLSGEQKSTLSSALADARKLAEEPQYQGLPRTIAARLPEADAYVAFPGGNPEEIPVGNRLRMEPERRKSQVFEEEGWALLPAKGQIRRMRDARGAEAWDFPEGTTLLHRIFLKAAPERMLFETRMLRKRADGKWAMGLYRPADGVHRPLAQAGNMALHTAADEELDFEVKQATETVRVSMRRLAPDICRHCHHMQHDHHGEGGSDVDEDHAGPCGFTPHNAAALTGDFARAYEKRHGTAPFGPPPPPRVARASELSRFLD